MEMNLVWSVGKGW